MSRRMILAAFVLAGMLVPLAVAQDNSNNQQQQQQQGQQRGGDGERRREGGGGFDPAAMRQRMMDGIKEQMGVTNEDEWKVIQGKLEPVMAKQMEVNASRMGAFGRGGRGGRDGNTAERTARNPVEQASNDLRKILEDKASTEQQIKEKLTVFREARDKARTELASAQKELKEVLMPRQEAVLVQYGLVD